MTFSEAMQVLLAGGEVWRRGWRRTSEVRWRLGIGTGPRQVYEYRRFPDKPPGPAGFTDADIRATDWEAVLDLVERHRADPFQEAMTTILDSLEKLQRALDQ